MKTVAYCRVSTNKEEQLDSLETQQIFFNEYAEKNGYELIKVYADEGKSGTKIKNRKALLKLLEDAEKKLFNAVLIKDVSRLARNTVDFLTSIRQLKYLNIQVIFVNYDQTTSESSEFMLTLLSAMAQEESANTSKRIKFGKQINKEKGRVPNFVFGYDKVVGNYFSLSINEQESKIVKEIFQMYLAGKGFSLITKELIRRGVKTKRGYTFNQDLVRRIVQNQIYIGNVINGKEETKDFLTGERIQKPENEWIVIHNENLRIIDDETFYEAQKKLSKQKEMYKINGKRNSQKRMFSKLIKCTCCGYSFRRIERKLKNSLYIKWTCSGRNLNGVRSCGNKNLISEEDLIHNICEYLKLIIQNNERTSIDYAENVRKKFFKTNSLFQNEKEISTKLLKLKKTKDKYLEMFENEIITISELKEKTSTLNSDIFELEKIIAQSKNNNKRNKQNKLSLQILLKSVEALEYNNVILSNIFEQIEVDEHNNINFILKNVHLSSTYT